MRIGVLGLLALGALVVLALAPSTKPRSAEATANPLPPLIACPNVDASPGNTVTVADILSIVQHFGKNYGASGYEYLWDPVAPYNSTSPAGTGSINVADILYVVQHFGNTCSPMETQIAAATRAIADPTFSSTLCDGLTYATAVTCGGDPQFLTQNTAFLLGKGYLGTGIDVPGQGVHYVKFSLWDGTFNPARPEGLVYKRVGPEDPGLNQGSCYDNIDNGGDGLKDAADPDCVLRLVAQLYYAFGGDAGAGIPGVGWGPDRDHNVGAVNTDALCTPMGNEPPGTGCGWAGTNDGWHWHANLCTIGIGTNPMLNRFATQQECADWGTQQGMPCTFPPTPNFTCTWSAAVGWMGHLWNWLPNANYTNAVNPGPGGLAECQTAYCAPGESNGRFADCFPDVSNWNAYNCPQ